MDHKAALLLRYMLRYIITGFVHRLHAGVLYILWLQVRQGPRGMHVHRGIHSALQGLIEVDASGKGNLRKAIIMYVSTAGMEVSKIAW